MGGGNHLAALFVGAKPWVQVFDVDPEDVGFACGG